MYLGAEYQVWLAIYDELRSLATFLQTRRAGILRMDRSDECEQQNTEKKRRNIPASHGISVSITLSLR